MNKNVRINCCPTFVPNKKGAIFIIRERKIRQVRVRSCKGHFRCPLLLRPARIFFVSEINSPYKDTFHTEKNAGRIKSVSEIKFTNKDVTRTKNMPA